jgi:hypothetical protein
MLSISSERFLQDKTIDPVSSKSTHPEKQQQQQQQQQQK